MKATLSFDLKEDQHAFDCVVNATKMHDVLLEMKARLRETEKYGEYTEEQISLVKGIRKSLHEAIEEAGMSHLF